jgi:hypothetical protein
MRPRVQVLVPENKVKNMGRVLECWTRIEWVLFVSKLDLHTYNREQNKALLLFFFFILFFNEIGFELGLVLVKQELCHWCHTPSPFFSGYFGDGVWPETSVISISSSQVPRIIGMSYWYLAVDVSLF